jgi:hypothetical protein
MFAYITVRGPFAYLRPNSEAARALGIRYAIGNTGVAAPVEPVTITPVVAAAWSLPGAIIADTVKPDMTGLS